MPLLNSRGVNGDASGVYLAEGTLFATRFARLDSYFHENSEWLWSSKEIKLFA